MKILFISTGWKAEEIVRGLKKEKITITPLIRSSLRKKIKVLLSGNYDIVHTDNAFVDGVLASMIASLRGKKSTCLVRGYGDHLFRKKYNYLIRAVMFVTEQISFKFFDHVFFVSQDAQIKMMNNFNIKESSIAPNGINPHKFPQENMRGKITKNPKDVIIISVTNLKFKEKEEGARVLIKSLNMLPEYVHLVILGGGKYLETLQDRVGPRVHILGFQKDVYAWLHSADIFAYCSFLDSFGMVMLEAQSSGLPIVASDVGGIPETTKHAIIVKPTSRAFALALRPLIESKKLREKQGKLNKKWIEKRDWTWATNNYIRIWKRLLYSGSVRPSIESPTKKVVE